LLQIKTDRPEAASFAGHGYLHDKNSYWTKILIVATY
jgi:hypothetical protein